MGGAGLQLRTKAASLEMPADEAVASPPTPPPAEEVSSTPEPPLSSQEEAVDLMTQYLAGFTGSPAEDGTQTREGEQMASKKGVNGTDNVV